MQFNNNIKRSTAEHKPFLWKEILVYYTSLAKRVCIKVILSFLSLCIAIILSSLSLNDTHRKNMGDSIPYSWFVSTQTSTLYHYTTIIQNTYET